MNDIDDDELILFHYRDGLPEQRLSHIERQLAQSASLRARYARLIAVLNAVDREPDAEPADGFEDRLWRGLHARIKEPSPSVAPDRNVIAWPARRRAESAAHKQNLRWGIGFATAAATVALAIGVIFFQSVPRESMQARQVPDIEITADTLAERVLTMKVEEHLRSTEAMLLTLVNGSDDIVDDPMRDDVLEALVRDNRLYSAAVERRGNRALAGFLNSMQALLIELANQSGTHGIQTNQELREFVSSSDLLFQVRAVQARLRHGSRSA